jgi:chorismate synthase
VKSGDYQHIKNTPRPGHADFVLNQKFSGYNDYRGGGHSSGRLTLALVAAGVVAKKIVAPTFIKARLIEAGGNTDIDAAIAEAIDKQDSIGGIVSCTATNVPTGLGEPFFNSVESLISHAIFSIPAVKGISFGSGFTAARMTGSQHNDSIINEEGTTATNHAGGINGGITNGNLLTFDVAIKPTSSTPKEQHTWNNSIGAIAPFTVGGRHDLCIALRATVVVEAVTAIVLADLKLQHGVQQLSTIANR